MMDPNRTHRNHPPDYTGTTTSQSWKTKKAVMFGLIGVTAAGGSSTRK